MIPSFLRCRLLTNKGVRNVYFPFDILSDTPTKVANEMVKEKSFWSVSCSASSQGSVSGLIISQEMEGKSHHLWFRDEMYDETTSQRSSHSGNYSNLNYQSGLRRGEQSKFEPENTEPSAGSQQHYNLL
ncbi:unnamed protein product [Cuscuta europaea]|uniref:Uncharacterized protein n=1 Tax=Cuscuta europaea TaxID=41803 RepID=A0A9P0ZC42_CUSEU|nr:unnamed protein product [Cuscuta europaea]